MGKPSPRPALPADLLDAERTPASPSSPHRPRSCGLYGKMTKVGAKRAARPSLHHSRPAPSLDLSLQSLVSVCILFRQRWTIIDTKLDALFTLQGQTVVDCRAHMLGRLASVLAKQLLAGHHVVSTAIAPTFDAAIHYKANRGRLSGRAWRLGCICGRTWADILVYKHVDRCPSSELTALQRGGLASSSGTPASLGGKLRRTARNGCSI